MTALPMDSPASAAARAALYVGWPGAVDIALLLRVSAGDVDAMRRSGALLAVWVHETNEYRISSFPVP